MTAVLAAAFLAESAVDDKITPQKNKSETPTSRFYFFVVLTRSAVASTKQAQHFFYSLNYVII
jgi:hypothetical protein